MNDNDIIEIMKVCSMASGCKSCRFADSTDCAGEVSAFALDLINRQKAEIEKLKRDVDEAWCEYSGLQIDKDEMFNEAVALIKNAGIKAIKEFVEKLKDELDDPKTFGGVECGHNYGSHRPPCERNDGGRRWIELKRQSKT